MSATDHLTAALELVPEAWVAGIAADAQTQGCAVSFTAAAGGLRTDVIDRVYAARTARNGDPEWEAMTAGEQLDVLFPSFNGIGAFELLAALGIAPVYVLTIH